MFFLSTFTIYRGLIAIRSNSWTKLYEMKSASMAFASEMPAITQHLSHTGTEIASHLNLML